MFDLLEGLARFVQKRPEQPTVPTLYLDEEDDEIEWGAYDQYYEIDEEE